jgi:hypothetical protein
MKAVAIAILVVPYVRSLPFASAVLEEKKNYPFLETITKKTTPNYIFLQI